MCLPIRILPFFLTAAVGISSGPQRLLGTEVVEPVSTGRLEKASKKSTAIPRERVEREAYLMGTRARLIGDFPSRELGLQRLEGLLLSLERAEQDLSTWRPDSFLSRLNRQPPGSAFGLNSDVCRLFGVLLRWTAETGSAFDPAIGGLVEAWDLRGQGSVPTQERLSGALRGSGLLKSFRFDSKGCSITRLVPARIDAGGFGKGAGLDGARQWSQQEGFSHWLIDLGGQVAAAGGPQSLESWSITLAHPNDRARPVLELQLSGGSLATSGGSERDLRKAELRIGHILDPRTGKSANFQGSVVVWHQSALVADILSTALFVMGPESGLPWAEERGLSACFLIADPARADAPPEIRASLAFRSSFLVAEPSELSSQ